MRFIPQYHLYRKHKPIQFLQGNISRIWKMAWKYKHLVGNKEYGFAGRRGIKTSKVNYNRTKMQPFHIKDMGVINKEYDQ